MALPETAYAKKVPGSLAQTLITTKYTFLDYIRSRRFAILLVLMLIISVLLTSIFAYYRPPTAMASPLSFYSTWWGMSASFVVILSGIFFGGDAISSEFQNKTGYFVLPNPIRRSSVYAGKFIAALIASSMLLALFTLITIANGLYYGFGVPGVFWESAFFDWIYLLGVLGFAFFLSSAFKSSSYSILVSIVFLLFGFSLIEGLAEDLAGIEPWFILTYGGEIVGNVLNPSGYPKHMETITETFGKRTLQLTTYNVGIVEGLAIIGAYFVVTAILGLALFERKEFN